MFKKIWIAVLLLACLGVFGECGKKAGEGKTKTGLAFPDTVIDSEILVTVNDQPLRGRDLKIFAAVFRQQPPPNISRKEYIEILLERLVDRTLILQETVAMGITVDDSTKNAVVRGFTRSIGGEPSLDQLVKNSGITREELFQNIKQDLMIKEFMDRKFADEMRIEESDARVYYDSNPQMFVMPDSVWARHILIRVMPEDSEEQKAERRRSIERVLELVNKGDDFSELARLYSDGPSKDRGGDLGYFARGAMVAPFDSAAFSLSKGQTSGIVESPFGYHIIKVEDKKDGKTLAYSEIKDNLMARMQEARLSEKLNEHLEELSKVAKIKKNY